MCTHENYIVIACIGPSRVIYCPTCKRRVNQIQLWWGKWEDTGNEKETDYGGKECIKEEVGTSSTPRQVRSTRRTRRLGTSKAHH
jgi:hypothetical protein